MSDTFAPAAARALLLRASGPDATSSAERIATSIDVVWTQLTQHFARLIGRAGIQTLQDRSVSIAADRLPWLAVPRQGSGVASWSLHAVFARRPAGEAVAEFAHLMDALITLLGRLIGDALVGRVLHELWPQVFPPIAKELP